MYIPGKRKKLGSHLCGSGTLLELHLLATSRQNALPLTDVWVVNTCDFSYDTQALAFLHMPSRMVLQQLSVAQLKKEKRSNTTFLFLRVGRPIQMNSLPPHRMQMCESGPIGSTYWSSLARCNNPFLILEKSWGC